MPVTSLHRETNRWLTSFGENAKAGDELTWSVGHPLFGREFTTIRLGEPVATDERGDPLFDEAEADVLIDGDTWKGESAFWATRAEIAAAKAAATFDGGLTLKGHTYERGSFGNWRERVAPKTPA